ncbi:MAG: class I SAM-dependent methyltransferase [Gammaproteobacteria bacterium]
MRNRILPAFAAAAALSLFAVPLAHAAGGSNIPGNPTLKQVVNGSWRTPAFVKRDQYRHPLQVLEFFGIRPDMTVVELDPAGGWWTEMLAPYLKAKGHLIETVPPEGSKGFMGRMRSHFLAKLKANPDLYSKVTTVPFAPPKTVKFGPPDSADLVITFRNLHDWVNADDGSAKAVFAAAYQVLKPGGVFGVTDHRALPFANGRESSKKLHRLPEDFVIEMGLDAGFRLAGVSEVNRNPKDPMTINIHHLPPDLSHDTTAQKKKYLEIGESDVFVMKFVKP